MASDDTNEVVMLEARKTRNGFEYLRIESKAVTRHDSGDDKQRKGKQKT